MSLDDEPVKFYLRQRVQIEQWATLRNDAAAAMDEWLERLGPELASAIPGATLRAQLENNAYPAFRLIDPRWDLGDTKDPAASIALEWVRGRTSLARGQMPYVGLRTPKDGPLTAMLRQSSDDARKRAGDLQSQWWAAYRYVAPPPAFPDEPDAYAAVLVEQLRSVWSLYAGLVPVAVAGVASPTPEPVGLAQNVRASAATSPPRSPVPIYVPPVARGAPRV